MLASLLALLLRCIARLCSLLSSVQLVQPDFRHEVLPVQSIVSARALSQKSAHMLRLSRLSLVLPSVQMWEAVKASAPTLAVVLRGSLALLALCSYAGLSSARRCCDLQLSVSSRFVLQARPASSASLLPRCRALQACVCLCRPACCTHVFAGSAAAPAFFLDASVRPCAMVLQLCACASVCNCAAR